MRYILIILILFSVGADAQMVIKAYPNYRPLGVSPFITSQAVYSVRKAVDSYTGSAMRIRKDTTGQPEQEIGFVGNELDTAAIKSFLNARSGFVVTWYNQNGSVNATQSTQANQPRIANLGVIDRLNGKVAIFFDGTDDNLQCDDLAISITGEDKPFSAIAVAAKTTTNSTAPLFCFGQPAGVAVNNNLIVLGFVNQLNDYRFQILTNTTNTVFDGGFYGANTQYLLCNFSSGLDFEFYSNNTLQFSNTYNEPNVNLGRASIGVNRRGGQIIQFWGGRCQELIYYSSDRRADRATIQTNINTYYGIY